MTRDEVIALAREAGLPYMYQTGEVANLGLVERFAALVAAHEREECAKVALSGIGEAVQLKTLETIRAERDRIANLIRSRD